MKQYDFFNKKTVRRIILLLLLTSSNTHILGQEYYSIFNNFNEFKPQHSSSLFFRIENINFFKNNEYNSKITDGYTLTGGLIKPKLVYYLNPKLRISIGANLLKYSGQDKLNKSTLLLSAVYKPNKKGSLIMGNLNNDNNHGMPEFLVNSEKYYTGDFENGIQYIHKGKALTMDAWVDWEDFIEKNDTIQEKFTVGISLEYKITKRESSNIISIPLYITVSHKGGEIDISDNPTSTISNVALGINYRRIISSRAIKYINLKTLFTRYKDHKDYMFSHFNSGNAIFTALSTNTKIGDFKIAYWLSKNYFSLYGLDLFYSVSSFDTQFYKKNRKMLNFKYTYRYKIGKDSSLGGSIENYYDLSDNQNNISASVFLVLNTNIFIKKLKK